MNSSLSYSVTSLAPTDINDKFLEIKHHFDSFTNNNIKTNPEHYILKNMAHVTLRRFFYLQDHIRDEEAQSALGSIRFTPVAIHATKLEIFRTQKHGNVLVVLVEKTPELQQLHDDLCMLLDPVTVEQDTSFERKNFNPHLSVLYNLDESHLEEAKQLVTERILPVDYTLTSFLFLRDVPDVVGERKLLKEYYAS